MIASSMSSRIFRFMTVPLQTNQINPLQIPLSANPHLKFLIRSPLSGAGCHLIMEFAMDPKTSIRSPSVSIQTLPKLTTPKRNTKRKDTVNDDRLSDSVEMVDELGNSASGNLLEFIAGLVIKAIVFQRIYRENIDRVIELDKNLVENPVQMKEELNFDYTQNSPVAFVPIMSCRGVGCGVNCEEKSLGPRVIPPNHKLEVNVLLTLPESGYNRNLGFFRPVIIPRTRPRDVPAVNNSTPKNLSELGSGQGFHVSDGNAESKD
ncbi:hypothetical protein GH714_011762 [Hevea brasiliensis]|uniref:Uncharacterized protein n=1 Tax=Hevea brasiliensis TaxID=3981 RepID=A0A6A6LTL7_HEVBR|nr:hypothetical protein GH714_011762 [Hevea brasiliensis]